MPLSLRWVGSESFDAIALARLHSYSGPEKDYNVYRERIELDRRASNGDYLLAEKDGQTVGTTTSLSMHMWMRGARFACQGIAFVGTIKTQRRTGARSEKGIASQMMHESLRLARERGQVITALMPFRASFYEHFGYGFAERRTEWTLPLAILPSGDFAGTRFYKSTDLPELAKCRQRMVEAGQCDIERTTEGWAWQQYLAEQALQIIDRADENGPVRSWMTLSEFKQNDKSWLRVNDMCHDSHESLLRQLHFLASLKDQYSYAVVTLPSDLPLHRLLKETQIPHRPVEHATASARPYTRMQIRILDHKAVLEALKLPDSSRGATTVAIHECERPATRLKLDLSGGRCAVAVSSETAQAECSDVIWASIVSGDLRAHVAARLGLLKINNPHALDVLEAFSAGPAPFSNEYF